MTWLVEFLNTLAVILIIAILLYGFGLKRVALICAVLLGIVVFALPVALALVAAWPQIAGQQ